MPQPIRFGLQLARPEKIAELAECVPVCADTWLLSTLPLIPNPFDGYYLFIDRVPGTETCGACLEWSFTVTTNNGTATGVQPELTIQSSADCLGLIVNFQGQEVPGADWLIVFIPYLDGVQFCAPVEYVYNAGGAPVYIVDFDATSLLEPWTNSPFDVRTAVYGPSAQQHVASFSLVTDVSAYTFAWNIVEINPDAFDFIINSSTDTGPPPNITIEFQGDQANLANVVIQPTLNGFPWGPEFRIDPV